MFCGFLNLALTTTNVIQLSQTEIRSIADLLKIKAWHVMLYMNLILIRYNISNARPFRGCQIVLYLLILKTLLPELLTVSDFQEHYLIYL